MELVRYDVSAHLTAKKWIWRLERDVDAVLTFRRRVELEPTNAPRPTPTMPGLPGQTQKQGLGL
jgi:hypothetical protein